MPSLRPKSAGFTLVELLVVVAIIGILTGLAVVYAGEPRANVQGTAGQVVGAFDGARLRAIATQRWQRARYDDAERRFVFEQATTEGMAEPTAWSQVELLAVKRPVEVFSIDDAANVEASDPDEFAGLDEEVWFAPDGSSQPRTIYFATVDRRSRARVVVYRITGTAVMKEGF